MCSQSEVRKLIEGENPIVYTVGLWLRTLGQNDIDFVLNIAIVTSNYSLQVLVIVVGVHISIVSYKVNRSSTGLPALYQRIMTENYQLQKIYTITTLCWAISVESLVTTKRRCSVM